MEIFDSMCSDYTERIWRYQDNSRTFNNFGFTDYTERIWRYQDNIQQASRTLLVIIPRGFGGIRTTIFHRGWRKFEIIPRGFGGIRTTSD